MDAAEYNGSLGETAKSGYQLDVVETPTFDLNMPFKPSFKSQTFFGERVDLLCPHGNLQPQLMGEKLDSLLYEPLLGRSVSDEVYLL